MMEEEEALLESVTSFRRLRREPRGGGGRGDRIGVQSEGAKGEGMGGERESPR